MSLQSVKKLGSLDKLKDFVNQAEKLGKYPSNTAVAMRPALKIVEEALLDDEPDDFDYLKEHLEEIYTRRLKQLNLSPRSLQTYIGRVRRVIDDFQNYGQEPKTLHSWKPKIVQRGSKTRNGSPQPEDTNVGFSGPLTFKSDSGTKGNILKTLVWSLRPDLSIQIQVPMDLNKNDVTRLTRLLELEVELTSGQTAT